MFAELKKKIAHYIIKAKYVKKTEMPLNFNKAISNSNTFFVILPFEEKDFYSSFDILKYLLIHKKEVTLFIPDFRYSALPDKEKFRSISFHIKQITRLNLPNNNLATRLKSNVFDVVLDLNRNENTFFSAVASHVNSKIRVGFKKPNSDLYYNMIIDRPEKEPEEAYFGLLSYLKMF